MSRKVQFLGTLCMTSAALLFGCEREEKSESVVPLRSPPSVATVSLPVAPAAAPKAPNAPAPRKAAVSEWVESPLYKFRVAAIERCEGASTGEKAPVSPAGRRPQTRPLRLGVSVDIVAKVDTVFASARDVTLEKGGVIFNSVADPKPDGICRRLLKPKQLRHGETDSGFVIFELPDDSYSRSATLAFRPTRWGGAPRVEVELP